MIPHIKAKLIFIGKKQNIFSFLNYKNEFLSVKWPFVGQPDIFICLATLMPMASISPDLHALKCKSCSQRVNWILVELENDIF